MRQRFRTQNQRRFFRTNRRVFRGHGQFWSSNNQRSRGGVRGVLPSTKMLIMAGIIELIIIIDLGKDSDVKLQQCVLESSIRGKVTSLFALLA